MTGKKRGELLRTWYGLVKAAQEDLANIITLENGKTIGEARGEVSYAADFIDWFAGEAPRIDSCVSLGTRAPSYWSQLMEKSQAVPASQPSNRLVTIKQPVGVCGIITPWNFPAAMVTRKVAAALAAGCPCVVKPAPDTPLAALVLANLASRAGFPPGALSIVTTRSKTVEVGKVLTQHPAIRKFSFTGSTAVGKQLAAQCTSTVKRVSLELGGNAPFIVFDDANLQKAADAIMASKFRLSGQTCVCANRVYVQEGVYDQLAVLLVDRIRKFRLGPGTNTESTMGPLITKDAVSKVDAHVKDALERGSNVLIGGQPETSLGLTFFQPTLLVDVPPDALCAREETFGPLLPMFKFGADEDAVKLANASEAGLAGYLFTERVSRAWKVAESLEVGMVSRARPLPASYGETSSNRREGSGRCEYRHYQRCRFALRRNQGQWARSGGMFSQLSSDEPRA